MGRSHHDLPYRNRTARSHQDREDKRLLHRLERRMGRQFLDDIAPEMEPPESATREAHQHGVDEPRRRPLQREG